LLQTHDGVQKSDLSDFGRRADTQFVRASTKECLMRPTTPEIRISTSLRSARRLAKAKAMAMAITATTALAATPARASHLALDVTGRITTTTDPARTVYHFAEAQLLELPPHSIITSTAWTSKSVFATARFVWQIKSLVVK
jgi:hypothetical protein